MSSEFRLPDLGEGVTEGQIVRVLVAEGDHVSEDQPLLEVETDKAAVEIPSPHTGVVDGARDRGAGRQRRRRDGDLRGRRGPDEGGRGQAGPSRRRGGGARAGAARDGDRGQARRRPDQARLPGGAEAGPETRRG